MSLDPQIQQLIEKLSALPKMATLSPAASRELSLQMVRARGGEATPVGHVEDRSIPGPAGDIPVRVYTPSDIAEPMPLLVFYHGGGHVFGSPETHDFATRNLCVGAKCKVVSVNYRKAPENKFPAAVDDAYAALKWCVDHATELAIDPARVAVGGDSAGGNLAAVVSLMARDKSGPALVHQMLVYPVADYRCSSDSYERCATGYGVLEAETMLWFRNHYLNSADEASDWRASPILASDLSNLPPTFLLTAEYDVLHDEGKAFAEALRAAGNDVDYRDYAGMIHGFFPMAPNVDLAVEAQADACAHLRAAFA
jgi:acetyl esterase